METQSEQQKQETSGEVANPVDDFVRRIREDWHEYAIAFVLIVLIPPALTYAAGLALVVWYEYTYPTVATAVIIVWAGGEWNIKRKEKTSLVALSQASSYIFEVAKHLKELDVDGMVFCSNEEFEIHVRKKNSDA